MSSPHPTVWMFSGQGSQYFAMGRELFLYEPVFRETFQELSRYAKRWTGLEITDIVYGHQGSRFDPFVTTRYSHPALFAVQFALDRTLRDRGFEPDYVLGYSLGEFVAFTVSGVISWQNALQALLHHADILERTPLDGRMMAVLDTPALSKELTKRFQGLELAAVNTPKHFVVTGGTSTVERAQAWLSSCDIDCVILPVSQPFHSTALEFADKSLRQVMESFPLGEIQTPIASAERASILYRLADGVSWHMTRSVIEFQKTLAELESSGPKCYVDLGPSGTLASFVRQNLGPEAESEIIPIITPFAQDQKNLETAERRLSAWRKVAPARQGLT